MVTEVNGESQIAFPALYHVLTTYFPSHALGREDREAEFMTGYAERGEDDPEFAGLVDELNLAIRSPAAAAPVVNEALGIELSPRETRVHLKDLLDRLTAEPPELDYTESEEFPQLQQVLLSYFPSTSGRRNRTIAFLRAYAEHGEDRAEFAGLADELRQAVKFPKRAQPVVNEALGTSLSVTEVRTELADLLDQLTHPEAAETETERAKPEPPSAEALLQGWFFRKVNPIPGRFRRYYFPLWSGLAAGLGLVLLGVIILGNLPVPAWLTFIPAAFVLAGFVIIAMFSITMWTLRNQMRNPEQEEERDKALAEYEAGRAAKQERRRRIAKILGP
jgi:hypothetical protein